MTQEQYSAIREEAYNPYAHGEAYAKTCEILMDLFSPYVRSKAYTFDDPSHAEDCLNEGILRVLSKLRRNFFDREEGEKTPEALQKWLFTVLRNVYFTELRASAKGRKILEKLQNNASNDSGGKDANGGVLVSPESDTDLYDAGADRALLEQQTLDEYRALLIECFHTVLSGRSGPQIILAWMAVSALMLLKNVRQMDAISALAIKDPDLGTLFGQVRRLMRNLPWIPLTESDWAGLKQKLEETQDGVPVSRLRYSDFTVKTSKTYMSQSINKRNDALKKALEDLLNEIDY